MEGLEGDQRVRRGVRSRVSLSRCPCPGVPSRVSPVSLSRCPRRTPLGGGTSPSFPPSGAGFLWEGMENWSGAFLHP